MSDILWILNVFGLLGPLQLLVVGVVVIAIIMFLLSRA